MHILKKCLRPYRIYFKIVKTLLLLECNKHSSNYVKQSFFPKFLKKILLPVNVFGSKQIIISKSTPGIRLLDIGKKRPRNVFLCFNIINILSSLP